MTKSQPTAQADAFDTTTEAPPEVKAVPAATTAINDSHNVIARANALVVSSPAEYVTAADTLQGLRGAFKTLETQRKGITDPMRAAVDRVMAFFKPHTDAIEKAGEIVKGKMNAYDAEQRRLADEARRRAEAAAAAERAEAERKAREQRELAEAEARRRLEEEQRQRREQEEAERRIREQREAELRAQREQEEAQRRGDAEAARRAQEQQDTARREREAEEQRARDSQRAAQQAAAQAQTTTARAEVKAEAHEVRATSVVAPVIAEPTRVAGIARRMVWKYKVKDEAAVKREFLALDEAKIARIVKAMGKDAESMVGGIECWQENDISARAK